MNYKTCYPTRSRMMDHYIPFGLNTALNNPWFEKAADEKSFIPHVDVAETATSYELHVALPGMEKDQIKVEVKDGLLTISGERKQVAEEGTKFKTIETHYGAFSRSFRLGETTSAETITAEFKNGILVVVVPKKETIVQPTSLVEIK